MHLHIASPFSMVLTLFTSKSVMHAIRTTRPGLRLNHKNNGWKITEENMILQKNNWPTPEIIFWKGILKHYLINWGWHSVRVVWSPSCITWLTCLLRIFYLWFSERTQSKTSCSGIKVNRRLLNGTIIMKCTSEGNLPYEINLINLFIWWPLGVVVQ